MILFIFHFLLKILDFLYGYIMLSKSAEMREKWYQKLNQEISKLDDITPCTYNNDEIATLPNKISHNGIQWGKIGSSQNQYSSISKYNEAIFK